MSILDRAFQLASHTGVSEFYAGTLSVTTTRWKYDEKPTRAAGDIVVYPGWAVAGAAGVYPPCAATRERADAGECDIPRNGGHNPVMIVTLISPISLM